SARAALALVASGEAPFGVVYATDAQAEPHVARVATFPEDSHPPVVYPIAAIAGHDGPASRAFLDWLAGPAARAIFTANGFTLPADERAQ
ncbi:MAG TPA: molybdate ABC transporter substrate-binding protein, partial [Rhodobacterales bacterium]|nr:molybdate ABC transporter substrate-binding protein [Rhodobacterales bacterium]